MKKIKLSLLILSILLILTLNIHAGDYTYTFIDAVVFSTTDQFETSAALPIYDYTRFNMMTVIDVTGDTATLSMTIEVLLSDDDTTYYKYNQGSFADLSYSTVDAQESYFPTQNIFANYMKIKATAGYCDSTTNYYTTSVKGGFKR